MTTSDSGLDRRSFLVLGAAAAGAAGAVAVPGVASATSERRPRAVADPFTMGIASGDPTDTSIILWTRLAPKPLDLDGGMPRSNVDVQWELASNENFSTVVKSGTATAYAGFGHSVHVDVQGLTPNSWYFYRFKYGTAVSPTGRTRTTPAPGQMVDSFVFGQTTCANWQSGFYQLYADLAKQSIDYWIALGDYIYEYAAFDPKNPDKGGYVRDSNKPTRPIPWSKEPQTLPEYRRQYGLYKSDPDLKKLHLAAPYSVIWDDHEVDNNYTGGKSGGDGQADRVAFAKRRAASYRAFYENHAIRMTPPSVHATEARIYRTVDWGSLARFYFLDGRQYRSDQPGNDTPNDFGGWNEGMFDPAATMLGAEQEGWLATELAASTARWNFIAQQTLVANVNGSVAFGVLPNGTTVPADGLYNYDSWDGYWAARGRLVQAMSAPNVRNPVVLTGDFHCNLAMDVLAEYPDPHNFATMGEQVAATMTWDGPVVAAEFAAGAISSPTFFGGNGLVSAAGPGTLKNTPWAKYGELLSNAYILHTVTPGSDEGLFRIANTEFPASKKAGQPRDDKTVVVVDGVPGCSIKA